MKRTLYISMISLVALVAGSGACKRTEHAESVTAEIEAAQMQGREAAREFLMGSMTDTADMQNRLLKVRALSSRYKLEGHKEAQAAFDTAFVTTVRTIHPTLREEL